MPEIHQVYFYVGFLAVFCYVFVVFAYCFKQMFCGDNPDPNRDGPLDLLTPRLEMTAEFRKGRNTIFDTVFDISDPKSPLNNV